MSNIFDIEFPEYINISNMDMSQNLILAMINPDGIYDAYDVSAQIFLNGVLQYDYSGEIEDSQLNIEIPRIHIQDLSDNNNVGGLVYDICVNFAVDISKSIRFTVDKTRPDISSVELSWGTYISKSDLDLTQNVSVEMTNTDASGQIMMVSFLGNNYTGIIDGCNISIEIPQYDFKTTLENTGISSETTLDLSVNVSDAAGNPANEKRVDFLYNPVATDISKINMSWFKPLFYDNNSYDENTLNYTDALSPQNIEIIMTDSSANGKTLSFTLNNKIYSGVISDSSLNIVLSLNDIQDLSDNNYSSIITCADISSIEILFSFTVGRRKPVDISSIELLWDTAPYINISNRDSLKEIRVDLSYTSISNDEIGFEDIILTGDNKIIIYLNNKNYEERFDISHVFEIPAIDIVNLSDEIVGGKSYNLTITDDLGNPYDISKIIIVDKTAPVIKDIILPWGEILDINDISEQNITINFTNDDASGQKLTLNLFKPSDNVNRLYRDYSGIVNYSKAIISIPKEDISGIVNDREEWYKKYSLRIDVSDNAGNDCSGVKEFEVDGNLITSFELSWYNPSSDNDPNEINKNYIVMRDVDFIVTVNFANNRAHGKSVSIDFSANNMIQESDLLFTQLDVINTSANIKIPHYSDISDINYSFISDLLKIDADYIIQCDIRVNVIDNNGTQWDRKIAFPINGTDNLYNFDVEKDKLKNLLPSNFYRRKINVYRRNPNTRVKQEKMRHWSYINGQEEELKFKDISSKTLDYPTIVDDDMISFSYISKNGDPYHPPGITDDVVYWALLDEKRDPLSGEVRPIFEMTAAELDAMEYPIYRGWWRIPATLARKGAFSGDDHFIYSENIKFDKNSYLSMLGKDMEIKFKYMNISDEYNEEKNIKKYNNNINRLDILEKNLEIYNKNETLRELYVTEKNNLINELNINISHNVQIEGYAYRENGSRYEYKKYGESNLSLYFDERNVYQFTHLGLSFKDFFCGNSTGKSLYLNNNGNYELVVKLPESEWNNDRFKIEINDKYKNSGGTWDAPFCEFSKNVQATSGIITCEIPPAEVNKRFLMTLKLKPFKDLENIFSPDLTDTYGYNDASGTNISFVMTDENGEWMDKYGNSMKGEFGDYFKENGWYNFNLENHCISGTIINDSLEFEMYLPASKIADMENSLTFRIKPWITNSLGRGKRWPHNFNKDILDQGGIMQGTAGDCINVKMDGQNFGDFEIQTKYDNIKIEFNIAEDVSNVIIYFKPNQKLMGGPSGNIEYFDVNGLYNGHNIKTIEYTENIVENSCNFNIPLASWEYPAKRPTGAPGGTSNYAYIESHQLRNHQLQNNVNRDYNNEELSTTIGNGALLDQRSSPHSDFSNNESLYYNLRGWQNYDMIVNIFKNGVDETKDISFNFKFKDDNNNTIGKIYEKDSDKKDIFGHNYIIPAHYIYDDYAEINIGSHNKIKRPINIIIKHSNEYYSDKGYLEKNIKLSSLNNDGTIGSSRDKLLLSGSMPGRGMYGEIDLNQTAGLTLNISKRTLQTTFNPGDFVIRGPQWRQFHNIMGFLGQPYPRGSYLDLKNVGLFNGHAEWYLLGNEDKANVYPFFDDEFPYGYITGRPAMIGYARDGTLMEDWPDYTNNLRTPRVFAVSEFYDEPAYWAGIDNRDDVAPWYQFYKEGKPSIPGKNWKVGQDGNQLIGGRRLTAQGERSNYGNPGADGSYGGYFYTKTRPYENWSDTENNIYYLSWYKNATSLDMFLPYIEYKNKNFSGKTTQDVEHEMSINGVITLDGSHYYGGTYKDSHKANEVEDWSGNKILSEPVLKVYKLKNAFANWAPAQFNGQGYYSVASSYDDFSDYANYVANNPSLDYDIGSNDTSIGGYLINSTLYKPKLPRSSSNDSYKYEFNINLTKYSLFEKTSEGFGSGNIDTGIRKIKIGTYVSLRREYFYHEGVNFARQFSGWAIPSAAATDFKKKMSEKRIDMRTDWVDWYNTWLGGDRHNHDLREIKRFLGTNYTSTWNKGIGMKRNIKLNVEYPENGGPASSVTVVDDGEIKDDINIFTAWNQDGEKNRPSRLSNLEDIANIELVYRYNVTEPVLKTAWDAYSHSAAAGLAIYNWENDVLGAFAQGYSFSRGQENWRTFTKFNTGGHVWESGGGKTLDSGYLTITLKENGNQWNKPIINYQTTGVNDDLYLPIKTNFYGQQVNDLHQVDSNFEIGNFNGTRIGGNANYALVRKDADNNPYVTTSSYYYANKKISFKVQSGRNAHVYNATLGGNSVTVQLTDSDLRYLIETKKYGRHRENPRAEWKLNGRGKEYYMYLLGPDWTGVGIGEYSTPNVHIRSLNPNLSHNWYTYLWNYYYSKGWNIGISDFDGSNGDDSIKTRMKNYHEERLRQFNSDYPTNYVTSSTAGWMTAAEMQILFAIREVLGTYRSPSHAHARLDQSKDEITRKDVDGSQTWSESMLTSDRLHMKNYTYEIKHLISKWEGGEIDIKDSLGNTMELCDLTGSKSYYKFQNKFYLWDPPKNITGYENISSHEDPLTNLNSYKALYEPDLEQAMINLPNDTVAGDFILKYEKVRGSVSKIRHWRLKDPVNSFCIPNEENENATLKDGKWQYKSIGQVLALGDHTNGGGPFFTQFYPWTSMSSHVRDNVDEYLTVTWKGREHFGKLHNLSTAYFRTKESEWVAGRELGDPNPLSIDIANQAHFFHSRYPKSFNQLAGMIGHGGLSAPAHWVDLYNYPNMVILPWHTETNTQLGSGYDVTVDYKTDKNILFPLKHWLNWGTNKFQIHLDNDIQKLYIDFFKKDVKIMSDMYVSRTHYYPSQPVTHELLSKDVDDIPTSLAVGIGDVLSIFSEINNDLFIDLHSSERRRVGEPAYKKISLSYLSTPYQINERTNSYKFNTHEKEEFIGTSLIQVNSETENDSYYFRNISHPFNETSIENPDENSIVYWAAMKETENANISTNKHFDISINELVKFKYVSNGWYTNFDNFPTYETRFDSASLNNKFDVDLSASIITSSTDVYTKCCIIIGDEINKSSIQIVEILNNKFTFNFTQDNYNDIVKSRDSGNWRYDRWDALYGATYFENPSLFGWDDSSKAPDCPRFHFNFKQAIIKSDKSYAANSVYKENYGDTITFTIIVLNKTTRNNIGGYIGTEMLNLSHNNIKWKIGDIEITDTNGGDIESELFTIEYTLAKDMSAGVLSLAIDIDDMSGNRINLYQNDVINGPVKKIEATRYINGDNGWYTQGSILRDDQPNVISWLNLDNVGTTIKKYIPETGEMNGWSSADNDSFVNGPNGFGPIGKKGFILRMIAGKVSSKDVMDMFISDYAISGEEILLKLELTNPTFGINTLDSVIDDISNNLNIYIDSNQVDKTDIDIYRPTANVNSGKGGIWPDYFKFGDFENNISDEGLFIYIIKFTTNRVGDITFNFTLRGHDFDEDDLIGKITILEGPRTPHGGSSFGMSIFHENVTQGRDIAKNPYIRFDNLAADKLGADIFIDNNNKFIGGTFFGWSWNWIINNIEENLKRYPTTFGLESDFSDEEWYTATNYFNNKINANQNWLKYTLANSEIKIGDKINEPAGAVKNANSAKGFSKGLIINMYNLIFDTSARLRINYDYGAAGHFPGDFHILKNNVEQYPIESDTSYFNIENKVNFPYLKNTDTISLRYTSYPYIGYDSMGRTLINKNHFFRNEDAKEIIYFWCSLDAWGHHTFSKKLKDMKNLQLEHGWFASKDADVSTSALHMPPYSSTGAAIDNYALLKNSAERYDGGNLATFPTWTTPHHWQLDFNLITRIGKFANGYGVEIEHNMIEYPWAKFITVHPGWNIIGTFYNHKNDKRLIDMNNEIMDGKIYRINNNFDANDAQHYEVIPFMMNAKGYKEWNIDSGTIWVKCKKNGYLIFGLVDRKPRNTLVFGWADE